LVFAVFAGKLYDLYAEKFALRVDGIQEVSGLVALFPIGQKSSKI
jgi:hypothetical protein